MYNLQLTLRCPQCASTYAKHTVWLMSIHRVCRVPCQAGFVSSQLWISPRLLLSVTSGLQCKSVPSFHSGLLSLVWVDGWCIKQLSSKISYNTLDSLFSQAHPPPLPFLPPRPFDSSLVSPTAEMELDQRRKEGGWSGGRGPHWVLLKYL